MDKDSLRLAVLGSSINVTAYVIFMNWVLDELENFEEDWNGKARQYLPEWSSALANDKMSKR